MPLTLPQTQAIADLGEFLADFLPGKPHPYADQSVSFEGIARDLGLTRFWRGGSKGSAVTKLLELTLEHDPKRFCAVVLQAVRRGIGYRQKKEPITREEIETLNDFVFRVGFKIKDLHDPAFLKSLPTKVVRPAQRADSPTTTTNGGRAPSHGELDGLTQKLVGLTALDPTKRGLAFEVFLNDLFHAFGLAPRGSFRLTGEQIDGSFELDANTYLVEAKWEGGKLGQEPLLVFAGKVAKKAQWSRGLFVSLSGFTDVGLRAFGEGNPTKIICMDGLDLHLVLSAKADFRDVVRRKARRAAEENRSFVSVRELIANVI